MPVILTLVALVAFAANSLLCRAALASGELDASTFTALRLGAGALALAPALFFGRDRRGGDWRGVLSLLAYAALFSFAYVVVTTGVGALLAFAAVQVTMVGLAWMGGERPKALALIGIALALAGLFVLVSGAEVSLVGALLMLGAGGAWGVYSHVGRGTQAPTVASARHFVSAALLFSPALLVVDVRLPSTPLPLALAVASGAVTSALGYVIWYRALKHHTSTSAASVQLAVPLIAALLGVVLLDEALSARMVIGGATILAGIALSVPRPPRP